MTTHELSFPILAWWRRGRARGGFDGGIGVEIPFRSLSPQPDPLSSPSSPSLAQIQIRKYFPETWLWELIDLPG